MAAKAARNRQGPAKAGQGERDNRAADRKPDRRPREPNKGTEAVAANRMPAERESMEHGWKKEQQAYNSLKRVSERPHKTHAWAWGAPQRRQTPKTLTKLLFDSPKVHRKIWKLCERMPHGKIAHCKNATGEL